MYRKLLLLLIVSGCMQNLNAQQDPIDTDRPDQTEAVSIVPLRFIQIELGFTSEKSSSSYKTYTIPTALIKYGLSKKTELRFITDNDFTRPSLFFAEGFKTTPLQVGIKTSLFQQKGVLPQTSLILHTSLQSENVDQKKKVYKPGFNYRFTFQNSISKKITAGYNAGMEWENFDEEPAYVYTFVTGISIGEKLYVYGEVFGSIFKNSLPENSIDAGVAYLINRDIKLDLSAGKGISAAAPEYYLSAGFSFRFNTVSQNRKSAN
jgi:hypothetical protein